MKLGKPTAERSRPRRRLTGVLRFVGWTTLAGILLLCGLVATSMLVVREKDRRDRDEFARLAPHEHRLAIYDAFWNQVSARYFDRRFTGFDWKALRSEWRHKAGSVSTDQDLYLDVLFQLVQQFPSSHFAITQPPSPTAPVATANGVTPHGGNALSEKDPAATFENDLGFEPVTAQRGVTRVWFVGDVSKGSAADRAGIEPGWAILKGTLTFLGGGKAHYAGEFVRLESTDQKMTFEQHGSYAVPETTRGDAEGYLTAHKVAVSFDITAPPAPSPQPLIRRLDGGVLYVRLDTFLEPVIIDKVLAAVDTADQQGLILDLRGNTGGLITQEQRLLSHLLPARTILGYTISSSGTEALRAAVFVPRYMGPLIVLIGPRTASAAEVVATAVKGNHRGMLIGRATNGSALWARRFPLPDGGSVSIPVLDFTGPDGKRIEGVGVLPDIEIIPTLSDIRAGHDLVLERAERELRMAVWRTQQPKN